MGCLNATSFIQEPPSHIDVTNISDIPSNDIYAYVENYIRYQLVVVCCSQSHFIYEELWRELQFESIFLMCLTWETYVRDMVTVDTRHPKQSATSFLDIGRKR